MIQSIAIYDYKLTNDQFLDLTPVQFYYLGKRHEQRTKQEDYRSAIIATVLQNINRGTGKALKPCDFFPSLKEDNEVAQKVMSDDAIINLMHRNFGKKES